METSPSREKLTIPRNEEILRLRPPRWADLIATVCHAGHIKPGPGTWGSAIGVILWLVAEQSVSGSWRTLIVFGIAVVLSAAGIHAATLVERAAGESDPSYVIIDEVVGQLFALIGSPVAWKTAIVGFLLFRLFDITKPYPIQRLEHLPDGTGIVMDDIGAGLYSLAILQLLLHFGMLG